MFLRATYTRAQAVRSQRSESDSYCTACFTDAYPLPIRDIEDFEGKRKRAADRHGKHWSHQQNATAMGASYETAVAAAASGAGASSTSATAAATAGSGAAAASASPAPASAQ